MSDAVTTLAPAPPARPLFARWLFERRLRNPEAGRALGVTREAIRLYCLDFDDPARVPPSAEVRARIAAWSGGAVPAWSFDDTAEARAAFFSAPAVTS